MKKLLFSIIVLLALTSCQQQSLTPKVFGRFVPERKDDFAWENEYAAFRMYGPALRPENPSNGVDLWLKATPELIVDSFYYREHVLGLPYHINYGKGLDCYKVAHTCGAGGLVVLTANSQEPTAKSQIWIGGPYDRWQILEQTPDRFVFRLEYDSLLVADHILRESITITAESGTPFNKAQVVLEEKEPLTSNPLTDNPSPLTALYAGGGIYLHDTIDQVEYLDAETVRYTEDALSDKTAAQMNFDYNGSTSQDRVAITVRTPGATLTDIIDRTLVSVRPYTLGDTLTYFFSASWSEYHNP